MTSGDASTFKDTLGVRTPGREDAAAILRVRRDAILAKATSHCDAEILNAWVAAGDLAWIADRVSDPDTIAPVV